MTSCLGDSDDVSKVLLAFERFCLRVEPCQVWTTNKEETDGGAMCPQSIFYQSSPALIKFRIKEILQYLQVGFRIKEAVFFHFLFDITI